MRNALKIDQIMTTKKFHNVYFWKQGKITPLQRYGI